MPSQNTLHISWSRAGGVSERAGAKAGGSNPSANDSFACRDGERHPGLLEGAALRGVTSERRSRSVRWTVWGSSRSVRRADDSGCPEDAEEGNAVAHAPQSVCTRHTHEKSSHGFGRRVLRSVLRPVHVDPHYAPGASWVVGRSNRHHGWASPRKREEPALGRIGADVARLAACHSSMQVEGRGTTRKGRRSRPPSLRGSRARV